MKECETIFRIKTVDSISNAIKQYDIDCALVCTSPLQHSVIIHECLTKNMNVFTELNLVKDLYEENIKLAEEKKLVLFLSSTAIYRKEMQYIISELKKNKSRNHYIYHVGQYLPDWHPWESYQSFFVGDKRTNGCRELLAVELPWLIAAFGNIKNINVLSNKITNLNIDYNDCYMIQLEHENGCFGSLIIDIICREAVRRLEIFGEELYIEWQGKPDTLKVKNIVKKELETIILYNEIDKLDGYSSTIIENQYLDELKVFFNMIEGKQEAEYTFEDDLYTLSVIDRIEEKIV